MSKRRGHGEGSIHQRADGLWCAISIPAVLLVALKLHKERQDQEGLENPHGLVFISTKGTPLDPDGITHAFKKFVKAANLPDAIHFHSLRHSCATLLLAQGVPMYVVKDILGHSQISTTMRYTSDIRNDA